MKFRTMGLWIVFLGLLAGIGYFAVTVLGKPTYRVKFDSNGGSKVESLQIKEENVINALPKTTKEGYRFVGWILENEIIDDNFRVSKDITLVAKWELADNKKYIIRFDSLGGGEIEDKEVAEGDIAQNIPEPFKENYQFIGWFYHNKEFDFSKPIISDMTLVAKWKYLGD